MFSWYFEEKQRSFTYLWWLLGITKMAGHSYPVSLGVPRWRPCQIPDPGQRLNVKIPTQGEALSVNFPWVARPPPPTLGLNIDRCIIISTWSGSLCAALFFLIHMDPILRAAAKSWPNFRSKFPSVFRKTQDKTISCKISFNIPYVSIGTYERNTRAIIILVVLKAFLSSKNLVFPSLGSCSVFIRFICRRKREWSSWNKIYCCMTIYDN